MPAKDRETRRRLHANWRAKQYEQGRRQITLWVDGPERELLETTLKRHRDGGAQIDLEDATVAAQPKLEDLSEDEMRAHYAAGAKSQKEREALFAELAKRRGWRTTFGLYPLEQLQRSWHAENKRRRGGAEKADRDNVPGVDLLAAYRKEFEARGLEPPDVEDPPPEEPSTPAGRGRGIVFRR